VSLTMETGAVPVEVTAPEGGDHKHCPICTGKGTPGSAYRPHTLDTDCWCIPDSSISRRCWVARAYPSIEQEA
jgi:hypothetical protein